MLCADSPAVSPVSYTAAEPCLQWWVA